MKRQFSIITAGFRAELLDRVWKSILGQDILGQPEVEFEWILVGDGVPAVEEWYRKSVEQRKFVGYNVLFIGLPENMGHFGLYARNEGAKSVAYDDVLFLDDDNEWAPNHVSSLFAKREETGKHPYSAMFLIGKRPGSTYRRWKNTGLSKQGIDLGCLLYTRQMFEDVGYFDPVTPICFDWAYYEKLIAKYGADAFVGTGLYTLKFHHKRY